MSGAVPGAAIERAIRAANAAGRPALAPFLTAGYPSRDRFPELLRRVATVGDVIEVGVPFSDPMADGVTIQEASRIALEDGTRLDWILDVLAAARVAPPVLLMSYLNPLLARGIERLAEDAARAGVAGLIVPDLPFEESDMLRVALEPRGVGLVQLVTPLTPPERMGRLAAASRGFVYAVTMTGITGGQVAGRSGSGDYLDRVRAVSALPVLAGFGIRTAADLRRVAAHADGAIVGSALIEVLGRGEDPVAFLQGLLARDDAPEEDRA